MIQKLNKKGITIFVAEFFFPLMGLFALLWFLIRVIPKPSRAAYPCMRLAFPLASSFVLYMAGIVTTIFAFKKARKYFVEAKYFLFVLFLLVSLIAGTWAVLKTDKPPYSNYSETQDHPKNKPIGEAKGIYPGRVVWVHNPDATNENASWKDLPSQTNNDAWFLDRNNDQNVIDKMLSDGIQALTGERSDKNAWDAIFKYFNNSKGKGKIPYQEGEKIFIKINLTSSWNINSNLTIKKNKYYGISETSPHLVLTVLRHLVNIVGVPQHLIYVGDPMRRIYKHRYDKWYSKFPEVYYLDNKTSSFGRTKVVKTSNPLIFYSDRGAVLREGIWSDATVGNLVTEDYLYTVFEEADYLINIPILKAHSRAGITMFAKNHFGSHSRGDAKHLHGGLHYTGDSNPLRDEYGMYRVLVDMMGHKLLGGNTLFFLMDALWSSDYEVDQPDKFQMAPFDNDWTSSLFLSQDMVAIESVGFDILRSEFTEERYPCSISDKDITTYPQFGAVDDYLHQAADSSTWAEGITYDPENDGTLLTSLGVHEHWNNPTDQKYSRNLGTGDGIELVKVGPH